MCEVRKIFVTIDRGFRKLQQQTQTKINVGTLIAQGDMLTKLDTFASELREMFVLHFVPFRVPDRTRHASQFPLQYEPAPLSSSCVPL
jgi:hypothetical protein